ncbi:ABC transporter permease [Rhodococcus sp. PAMC28707]|uniref:ABC transporter permease n=1 Tax=unclassified Rhodococcus (in: high G+C Gram-positive bacteria) TaxID=192944 RepID=UPI00109DCF75|nr:MULTISPECIES: ABC transporter permease [unclassified Rhodococcus (in: high G+C Gram-positive bacteria)]QCB50851.1 ABC transporter permease [Rhodococcus sp. PAMC28705]QCB57457.1 ABC transporter permease [Rhodococcus sp. PAMC28707]
MKRTLNVARMHAIAWPLIIGWPLVVLAISFVISYTIFALVPTTDNEYNFTGSVFSMYGFAIGFYIQAVTQTFPFALGISVTRREFFNASALVALVQSAVLATLVYVLSIIEASTGGFGVKLRMFGIFRYATDDPALQWLGIFTTVLLVAAIGLVVGVVYQRYRVTGIFGLGLASIVLLGGGAIVVTWQRWWPEVGDFFVDTPRILLLVVIPLVLTAIFGLAGWAGLRRATA